MNELRFDGQVAIVTGAGGHVNLGRSYARLLGSRGAKVVVNDILDADGGENSGANRVAREIVDAGGEAVGDTHSIDTEDGATAIVQTAVDAWGQVDILVNNAGAMIFAKLDEMSSADSRKMIDTHLMGALWMTRAVWPHFKAQRYGRIVMALSTASGLQRVMYGTVKGGMRALNYGVALSGQPYGIKCNGIVPLAGTDAMSRTVMDGPAKTMLQQMSPDLVAPAVGVLAHRECPVNGEEIFASGGRVSLFADVRPREGDDLMAMAFGSGPAYTNPDISIDDLYENWDQVVGTDFRPLIFPDEAAIGLVHEPYRP